MHPTTTRATPATTGLRGQLNTEWQHLRHSPVPATWAQPLPHYATVGEVLDDIAAVADSRDADPLLHALLTSHHDGNRGAGRAVLQTMLGTVRRLESSARGRHLLDPEAEAVTAMWAAVASYPLRRTRRVAANLALSALDLLPDPPSPEERAALADAGLAEPETLLDRQDHVNRLGSDSSTGPDHLTALLAWAADHQVISPADIALLATVHLTDHTNLKDAAARLGRSHAAARQAHRRAVQTLTRAVTDAFGSAPAFLADVA